MKKIIPYHGAGILFWTNDDNGQLSVLLGKRSINPGKGKWSIPGGGWSKYSDGYDKRNRPNYLQAAIRETNEESKYAIKSPEDLDTLWCCHIPYFHFEVYSCYLPMQIEFTHNREFLEVDWFPVEALPEPYVWFLTWQVSALKNRNKKDRKSRCSGEDA